MDILLILLEQAGNVVSKQELIARVWPKSVVEDGNLLSSRTPADLPEFMKGIITFLST